MNAISKIHAAANSACSGLLDEEVYFDNDLALHNLFDVNRKEGYIDVPFKKIVALGRRGFWTKGQNWRQVTQELHGRGWAEEVFTYFESELREQSFPAPESLHALKLNCYGGVCCCVIGNHRLVAAKSWLVSKYGNDAVLKKVKVFHYPLEGALRQQLTTLVNNDSDILMLRLKDSDSPIKVDNGGNVLCLLATKKVPREIYAWLDSGVVVNIDKSSCFIQRINNLFNKPSYLTREWSVIPKNIVYEMLDDEWIYNSETLKNSSS